MFPKRIAGLAWLLLLLFPALSSGASKDFSLEITVKDPEGNPLSGLAVKVLADSGEPFAASGVTSVEGRYDVELPDFDRVYKVELPREDCAEHIHTVDIPSQGFKRGTTVEVGLIYRTASAPEIYNCAVKLINGGQAATPSGVSVVALLTKSAELDPAMVEPWRALSAIHIQANSFNEALGATDRILAFAPNDPAALRDRYDALIGLQRPEEAVAVLESLITHAPGKDTARLVFNQGVDAMKNNLTEAAEKRFIQASQMDPSLHQAHTALAEVYVAKKNYEAAIASLDEALDLTPRNCNAWRRKAELLRHLKREKEAVEVDKKMAELQCAS